MQIGDLEPQYDSTSSKTCQDCGYYYDVCVCNDNEILTALGEFFEEHKAEQSKWTDHGI